MKANCRLASKYFVDWCAKVVLSCLLIIACRSQVPAADPASKSAVEADPPADIEPLQWEVVEIDGKRHQISTLNIDDKGRFSDAAALSRKLDDLRSVNIVNAKIAPASKPNIVAELPGGGKLFASAVTIANEKLTFQVGAAAVVLSIDAVRAIHLAANATHEPFDVALANPSAEQDTIFFRGEDRNIVSVVGLTETFTPEKLTFDWEGEARNVDRDQLWGIVFAGSPSTVSAAPATVVLRDGAKLPGRIVTADSKKLSLALGGSQMELPWQLIAKVEFRSSRVAYLSDLEPLERQQTPLVTAPLASRADRNVLGQPLRLGDQAFDKGWGTHAEARLEFSNQEGFDWLLGTVGHDPLTRGEGDCLIVVQGDGREIFSQRIRGSEAPVELKVALQGVKKVTLLVEAGEDLDLADYVNWCDLRFLRQANESP